MLGAAKLEAELNIELYNFYLKSNVKHYNKSPFTKLEKRDIVLYNAM